MIETLEELLQGYASYSYLEGTIDENTMLHLTEDAQNYIAQLKSKDLLSIKENMVEEINEILENIAIKFDKRKMFGTTVVGCDWYANEVRKYKK